MENNKFNVGDRALVYPRMSDNGELQPFVSFLSDIQWFCQGAFFNPNSYPSISMDLVEACANRIATLYYSMTNFIEWHRKDMDQLKEALVKDTLKVFETDKDIVIAFSSPQVNTYLQSLFFSYIALLDSFTKLSVLLISGGKERKFNKGYRQEKLSGKTQKTAGAEYIMWLEEQVKYIEFANKSLGNDQLKNLKEKINKLVELNNKFSGFFTEVASIRNNFGHYHREDDFKAMFTIISKHAKNHEDTEEITPWQLKGKNDLLSYILSMDKKIRCYLKESLLTMPLVRIEHLDLDRSILNDLED